MRSRSAVSVLAGLGAVTLIGTVGVHPVYADETPSPETTVTDTPSDPPPATETPTDPPTSDPPTDPPTSDPPTDPPTSDPPTDPPTSNPPTDPPTDPPTSPPPTTTPTDPPTTPPPGPGKPKTPVLSLGLTVSQATMKPGGSITATVRISSAYATATGVALRMSASGASVSPGAQSLGSVGSGGAAAIATVRAPSNAKPGVITLRASVSAAKARSVSRTYKLIITSASGALPPGISAGTLPPGVPPLTPSGFNPLAGMKGPQVALPPIVPANAPQIAPASGPLVPVSNLRTIPAEPFTYEELAALQAGFLAALGAGVTLLLMRLRLIRRSDARAQRVMRRRLRAARRHLAGKRPTAARLRTLPPQPARARPVRPLQPVPPIRLSVGQVRVVRP